MVFDWRLVHAVPFNTKESTRKTLYLAYGPRWLERISDEYLPEDWLADPIVRQLFGGPVTPMGNYLPQPEDVPLLGWMRERNMTA